MDNSTTLTPAQNLVRTLKQDLNSDPPQKGVLACFGRAFEPNAAWIEAASAALTALDLFHPDLHDGLCVIVSRFQSMQARFFGGPPSLARDYPPVAESLIPYLRRTSTCNIVSSEAVALLKRLHPSLAIEVRSGALVHSGAQNIILNNLCSLGVGAHKHRHCVVRLPELNVFLDLSADQFALCSRHPLHDRTTPFSPDFQTYGSVHILGDTGFSCSYKAANLPAFGFSPEALACCASEAEAWPCR